MIRRDDSTFSQTAAQGRLEITLCTPRIARIRLILDDLAGPAYVAPRAWPAVEVEVRSGHPSVLATDALTIQIDEHPLRLTFGDARGTPLLWAPIDEGVVVDALPRREDPTPNGEPGDSAARRRIRTHFTWPDEQHFYGLGEGGRQFDRLGGARQLWNSHFGHGPGSDIGIPLLLSTAGYGLFFDNPSDARLIVGRTEDHDRIVYEAEDGPLDWYFLQGSDLRGVLAEVASLLGRAPLPPRWSLGFLQSTRHFEDTAEVRGLAARLRERRIPCDGLVFLSTYGDAMGWNRGVGHLEFQPQLMPQPAELMAELHARGFQVIIHEYPVLHEESPLFTEALERGYLLAEGYERRTPAERPSTDYHQGQRFIDFSNPAARAWWWAVHRLLADLGVGGWWLDGGEGPPAGAALHEGDGRTLHNLYDRLRQQGFAEGEDRDYPDRRPFLLCRSGATGMQQYGATCWSGDINNTFATLEAQIPLGLNTGMSGIPYWGTDIGGFFHPMPESGELYARWFQFGAFCPGFRAHGFVWRDHLPWAHGEEVEAICRLYAELRYRLLPYTYTLAWQAHTQGLPLMRPLVLNYPDDPAVWELGSQYLWGDDLLVAPVTRQGATAWPVYLPAGPWYDYWTHRRHDGPVGVMVEAPLDRLPLFVRGGAILPLAPAAQFDGERPWDEITLLIYPAESSRFEFYEDDGRTNGYRRGRYAITPITCANEGGRVTIHIGASSGDGGVIPATRVYTLQVRSDAPSSVRVDDMPLPRREDAVEPAPSYWHDDGHFTYVRLHGSVATVSIEL
jgi:alpha-glucosidase (family GH31 glycosyl hydrolase)